jgi:hypothetical protein
VRDRKLSYGVFSSGSRVERETEDCWEKAEIGKAESRNSYRLKTEDCWEKSRNWESKRIDFRLWTIDGRLKAAGRKSRSSFAKATVDKNSEWLQAEDGGDLHSE